MQIRRHVQNFGKCYITELWNYLKRKAFKWVLNVVNKVHSLIYSRIEFHTSGAAQLYARVFFLLQVRGTTNWLVSLNDRNLRAAIWLTSSSDKYCCWCRLNAWNVRIAMLNVIRSWTGSQCNVTRLSDTWERYGSFINFLITNHQPILKTLQTSNVSLWDSRQKSVAVVQSWKYDGTSNRQGHVHTEGWLDVCNCAEVIFTSADYVVDAPVTCKTRVDRYTQGLDWFTSRDTGSCNIDA